MGIGDYTFNLQSSDNGKQIRCFVTNLLGSAYSSTYKVMVLVRCVIEPPVEKEINPSLLIQPLDNIEKIRLSD